MKIREQSHCPLKKKYDITKSRSDFISNITDDATSPYPLWGEAIKNNILEYVGNNTAILRKDKDVRILTSPVSYCFGRYNVCCFLVLWINFGGRDGMCPFCMNITLTLINRGTDSILLRVAHVFFVMNICDVLRKMISR